MENIKNTKKFIKNLLADAQKHRISTISICNGAKIHPSTVFRWKNGLTEPKSSKISRFEMSYLKLLEKKQQKRKND